MRQLLSRLKQVNIKIDNLIKVNTSLQYQNGELREEVRSLTQLVENQKNTISELEEQNKLIKLAKNINEKEGNPELRRELDAYIKEIDKCIELINNN